MTPKTPNFIEGNVTSAILKNVLLSYYRYERGYSHVVTEFFDLEQKSSKYGVIAITKEGTVKVLRKASKLHTTKVADKILERMVARLTSEMITLRHKIELLQVKE